MFLANPVSLPTLFLPYLGMCPSRVQDVPLTRVSCACRQWMKEVLQPLNEKAASIVVERADLLEASSMDPLLMQLVAHVSANRVILSRCV
jgi:hypothetical protein